MPDPCTFSPKFLPTSLVLGRSVSTCSRSRNLKNSARDGFTACARTSGGRVNEFPSRDAFDHCIFLYRFPIFEWSRASQRHALSFFLPPYYIFETWINSSFSTPFAISPPRFFFLRSKIPSSYCSPSLCRKYTTRADLKKDLVRPGLGSR